MESLKNSPGVIGNAPRAYVTVDNVMCILGCGRSRAYEAIRAVNRITQKKGGMAFPPGKSNKYSFAEQFDIPMRLVDEVISQEG